MKILLIIPPEKEIYGGLPPSVQMHLGVGYIAAVCERNNAVEVVDMEAEKVSYDILTKIIETYTPEVVGITCTTPVFHNAVKIAKIVKCVSNALTVLGGIHPTILPDESLSHPVIDVVVKGEGERTFVELLECIEAKGDLSKVKGIAFRSDGAVISTPARELIQNLDEIPFPARHLFKNQKYTYPDSISKNTFSIITSRGCPGSCTFCNTKNIFGRKFRERSAKNTVDEIEFLIKKYNAKEIHIWDDNFTVNKNRVLMIRDELKKRSIKIKFAFPNGLRVDFLSKDILDCLKDMGTYSLAIGVESGNQEILNNVKKRINLEQIESTFEYAKNIGLETWAFFMLGLPGETKETINETIKFAKKLNPDIAKFHILKPYPGTEVYSEFLKEGLLLTTDYSKYGIHTAPVHRLPNLSPEEIFISQKVAYRKFYFQPKKIIQQIFRLKSVNRLKLNITVGFAFLKNLLRSNYLNKKLSNN